ncbi:MAG: hypothetical protein JNG88_04210, partial [Phycisphaerales bacterium]|nr:hypothetical protein [Phycisphaerales bacterium]
STTTADVWYTYTAPSQGVLAIDTCTSAYDTVVSVHSACTGTTANELACNDDCAGSPCGGTNTCLSLNVTGGTTYKIRVSGYNGAVGTFTLNIIFTPTAPTNDNCGSATPIGDGVFTGNLTSATNDGSAGCGTSTTNKDVWYSYTAACAGTLTATTCGTHDAPGADAGMDTVLSLHPSCPGTTANQLACNDDTNVCGGLDAGVLRDSAVSTVMAAGQTVLIRVSYFNTVIDDGNYTLRTSFVATPPGAPTGVAATDGTVCANVTVTWNAVAGATNYEIWRNTSNDSGTAALLATDTASPYNDASATVNVTYFYWVKAVSACGTSGFSNSDSGFRSSAPGVPSGVSATDGTSCSEVTVTWTAVSGATSYQVYRNTTNNSGTATQIGTPAASPFSDTTATPGTTYFYWVRAVNVCGTSGFSTSNSGFRAASPVAPTGVSATDGTSCSFTRISWTASSGATGYEIWRNTVNNSGTATMIGTDTASPFDDTTGTGGVVYFYWVRATNGCGTSGFSNSDSGSRIATPTAPTGVAATDGTACPQTTVTWTASAGATSYDVFRNTVNNSGTAVVIGTTASSPFADATGTAGVTYFYWVIAENACGSSGFSNSDSGRRVCSVLGDMNCDGVVDNFDIDPFVLALTNPAAYNAAFPGCSVLNGDANQDGALDNFDIDPFVLCVLNGGC